MKPVSSIYVYDIFLDSDEARETWNCTLECDPGTILEIEFFDKLCIVIEADEIRKIIRTFDGNGTIGSTAVITSHGRLDEVYNVYFVNRPNISLGNPPIDIDIDFLQEFLQR